MIAIVISSSTVIVLIFFFWWFLCLQQMPNEPLTVSPVNRPFCSHRRRQYKIWDRHHWSWRKSLIWHRSRWPIKHPWKPLSICSESWDCAKYSSHTMGMSADANIFHSIAQLTFFFYLFLFYAVACWASSPRKTFCGTWNKWTTKIPARFSSIRISTTSNHFVCVGHLAEFIHFTKKPI